MRQILDKFSLLLLQPLHKGSVFLLGLYTTTWGAWVATPFWSVFERSELFSAFGVIAPEVFWGLLAMVTGMLIMWGALKESPRSLLWGARLGWVHWLMIAVFYVIGDWHSTGGVTSLFIAGYSAYLFLNMRINYQIHHKSPFLDPS
jgi:hypothetical protein